MGKSSCFSASSGIKRGSWTPEEDRKLLAFIQQHGHGSWRSLPQKAGLQRCGKSCRLRWRNYLRPDIKRGNFSEHEDQTIIQLHALLGNRWSAIAVHLPKRTDNEIKNYWNTHLKKRLAKIGFDPVTPKAKTSILGTANGDPKNMSNLSHIAQWENVRLQAEARFVKESKLRQHETPDASISSAHHQLLPDETALLTHHQFAPTVPHFSLDILRAWESALSMSKSSRAAPTDSNNINGQDLVSFGRDYKFEAPTSEELASMMMDYDDSRAMSSMTTRSVDFSELLDQHGNECSELFAALHHNMVFEVGDAWATFEQMM